MWDGGAIRRSEMEELPGGVSWRSGLAVWLGGARRMDQPTSIAQPGGSGLGWDAAESLALSELAPFAWRSQLAVRLGGVAWRSDLAERLGGVRRMDQQTAIGQPGGSGPGWDAADSLALSDWRPLLGGVCWRSDLAV